MKPIVHVYLKMIKRKISPLNSITWLTKTSSFARIVWFYWGSNISVNVRQNKMHLSFSCKLQNAYSRSLLCRFFFKILFWACTFSISIWYIFTYLTLNWMKVVWKLIFENRIYKIFPYILWNKFWCFWFKHSTMSLSYCLCWLRQ